MATDSGFNGPSGSTGNTGSTDLASSWNQVAATTRRMSSEVYDAAVKGKVDVLQQIEQLEAQLTPNKNTVLHVHIRGGMVSQDFVSAIIKHCPLLLSQKNIKEETALHMAAKEGLTDIVKALVGRPPHASDPPHATDPLHAADLESGDKAAGQKEMVWMRNEEGDTALHEAVRYNRVEVVKVLIEQGADFECCRNKAGETPIYLAVKRGSDKLVDVILETCNSPSHFDGPNGLTALHLAVICSDTKGALMATKILEKMPNLTTKTDENGWTPLHYAAYFGKVSLVEELLKKDASAAYIADKAGRIPLHIAASHNHVKIMEKLISYCPDCTEVVDKRRCNVLHLAVQARSRKAVELILKKSWGCNLVNDKDIDGNTPLHLSASSLSFVLMSMITHPRVDRMAVNNKGLTVADILSSKYYLALILLKEVVLLVFKIFKITPAAGQNVTVTHMGDDHAAKEKVSEIKDGDDHDHDHGAKDRVSEIKKVSKTHLIVAALIATVTYAAGFTLPGGYKEDKGSHRGMAVLAKKATFIAFFVTDGIAMCLSTAAVAIHFFMTLEEDQEQLSRWFELASYSTIWAMVAMVAAFLMAASAVLFSSSVALAALLLFLSIHSFLLCFFPHLLAKWSIGRG